MRAARRPAVVALACLSVASCSETVPAPPLTPTASTSASKTRAPAPITGPLEKDWKSYGGTAYFGCPQGFSTGKSVLETIRPKIFDPKTGQYVAPAIPAGQNVTGALCALTGSAADMKVVYLVTTAAPAPAGAPEISTTTAYSYDAASGRQVAAKELQPPAPGLKSTAPAKWGLASTASGVAWVDAFTDGRGAAAPPRTVVLSGADLSIMWDDPQPARAWQDVLAFQRSTDPAKTSGAELRRPNGEAIYQDNDVQSVDAELSDGPSKLVKLTHRDSQRPPAVSTMFYDLDAKTLIRVGDSDRIPGAGLTAALSDGKLFVDGHNSDNSSFGFGVWNLRSQRWDFLKSRDDAKKMSLSKVAFFEDHLYLTGTDGTHSVIALPATEPVASGWSIRPFERISGWTLVCRGETAPSADGECKEIVMVQDRDGRYPGPWF